MSRQPWDVSIKPFGRGVSVSCDRQSTKGHIRTTRDHIYVGRSLFDGRAWRLVRRAEAKCYRLNQNESQGAAMCRRLTLHFDGWANRGDNS